MDLTQQQRDFLFAFLWETANLEMQGPAHQIAQQHGVSDIEMAARFNRLPSATQDFWQNRLFRGPSIPVDDWPWGESAFCCRSKVEHEPPQLPNERSPDESGQ